MKRILLLLLLTTTFCFGQQYDGVYIETSEVDENNIIYKAGRTFMYTYNITEGGTTYKLSHNAPKSFELTPANSKAKVIENIKLIVFSAVPPEDANENQTQIMYAYEPNSTTLSATGIVENKENVWIHPPRDGFFQSLETCPFPYIKLNKPVGYEWSDEMLIGSHWSDKKWGTWEGQLLLKYKYKIAGRETVATKVGSVSCLIINASADSEIGKSHLKVYYSAKYGFVKLEYTLFTGIKVNLELIHIVEKPKSEALFKTFN